MNMKKLASLLALVLVLAMAVPAMAETATTTISVAANDTRSYAVYQIFTGDLYDGILSNVVWGQNGTGTKGAAVPAETLKALEAVNGKTDVEQLAEIKKYVDLTGDALGTVSATAALTVPTGYYLIKDLGTVAPGEAYSLYVVQIVGPTTISPKRGTVESNKKVDDENDSNTGEDTEDWQDSADYDIGDAVPFKLTGTVAADYDNYKTYKYIFHDKESAGLTFNADSVEVYVDDTMIQSGYIVSSACTDGCTFEIIFNDLKKIDAVKANSVITVEYTSTLNDKAVLGSAGNPNEMYLEYSNNPNVEDGGETGKTVVDKVIVFTYKVVANKIDEDEEPLAGAGFTLYKKNDSGEYVPVGDEVAGENMTTFEWKGLDDGDYKLVETTTPNGYNTLADIEFTIAATHEEESDNPKLLTLTGGNMFTGNVEAGTLSADIVNEKGSTLPETGGMGTTILYVAGGLLVLGAVIVLITKKRMAASK